MALSNHIRNINKIFEDLKGLAEQNFSQQNEEPCSYERKASFKKKPQPETEAGPSILRENFKA